MKTVKNYMEEIVKMFIGQVMDDLNLCKCNKCKRDIYAMSLNTLPPKYIVTNKGELYAKVSALKQQFEVDVVLAITKAAMLVKEKPRH